VRPGVPVQAPGRIRRPLKEEKGSILVETVLSALVLVVLMFAVVEVAWLLRDNVYLQRVAREAAREAALVGDLGAGYARGKAASEMYFGDPEAVGLRLDAVKSGRERYVVAQVFYSHRFFGWFSKQMLGGKEVIMSGRAVFGWYDFGTEYID